MKIIMVFLFQVLSLNSIHAGQGRDGGWPESIQLLKLSRENLVNLVKQTTDQDIKDAINNMRDREELIKPEEVNQKLLLRLVESVVDPDVEQIENSTYDGVRLFYYDNSHAPDYRIYATKNFFNLSKYQLNLSEINISLVKEVQTLILHEISHLWGFGEDTPETNYARIFATRMIEILHGNFKKNYTLQEKMLSLNQAFSRQTTSLQTQGQEFKLKNKSYECLKIYDLGETTYSQSFTEDNVIWSGIEGHSLRSNENLLIRGTMDDYLIIEENGASPFSISSLFNSKGWFKHYVKAYHVCHPIKENLEKINERFIAPYYSRSNFMTDLDYASPLMFRFLIADRMQKIVDNGKQTNQIQRENQDQLIHNIDFKIKVQMKEDWDWLISRNYKYTRDRDRKISENINGVINSDLSNQAQTFYAVAGNLIRGFNTELNKMKNISRATMLNEFLQDFVKEVNAIFDLTVKDQKDHEFDKYACYKEKKIGKFYECYINDGKIRAQDRIQLYNRMDQSLDSVLKTYLTRLQKID